MAKKKNKSIQVINPDALDTYFKKRMFETGIADTSAFYYTIPGDFPSPDYKQPIFSETAEGNIQIAYPCLYGGPETYLKDKKEENFTRVRYAPANEKPGFKYYQESGSGSRVFFPPAILDKFAKANNLKKEPGAGKIETLFIVEGEFKAMSGSIAGLDIIGIGGKDNFTEDKQLHKDIAALITVCNPENVCLLLDADIFTLDWWVSEGRPENANLAKRLNGFYNTVKRFSDLTKGKAENIYFASVRSHYVDEAKGLDDLLHIKRDDKEKVTADLLKLKGARAYFDCLHLSHKDFKPLELRKHFLLPGFRQLPIQFYSFFKEILREDEFNFFDSRYQYNRAKDGLHMVRHADSYKFKRIGCDYYKIIHVPNSKGILERSLVGWKTSEITRDYVDSLGIKNFYDTIDKFENFCNVPEHNPEKFKQEIEGCYNLYFKLTQAPAPGSFPKTEFFLKHLFGEKKLISGHTNYDLALDWLTILYRYPIEKLPSVCLVSAERETGKSTFLFWLREVFTENATIVGNSELTDRFNEDFVTKLIVGVDETFVDKKLVHEHIKSLITNHKAKMQGKYTSRRDVPFIAKFVMTSNNEGNFMPIDDKENRFWVNRVPALSEDQKDPLLMDEMIKEIPAFLHFIKHREILHPRKTRLWFSSSLIETEAGQKVRESNRGWFEAELREIIEEEFFDHEYHTLYYTIGEVFKKINTDAKTGFRRADAKNNLLNVLQIPYVYGRRDHPVKKDESAYPGASKTVEKRGWLYEFKAETFLPAHKLDQFTKLFYTMEQIQDYRENVSDAEITADTVKGDDMPF